MLIIDYIILVILVAGALHGCLKGLLKQLASVLGLVIGLIAARALYLSLAEKVSPMVSESSMTIVQIISFVAIWAIVPLLFFLLASVLTHALEAVSLGWVNRLLGFLLGTFTSILVLGILMNILDYLDVNNVLISGTIKEDSVLYYPIKHIISGLFPVAKELTQQYLLT
ncbi:CvpA family protein [Bacteroides sp. 224]|uniref:CvpA family protein n=1 Tax=Bacteroides sp. 224 TaxID=2302936 RepID=UPI0013D0C231|nr:CvpA family protein [Bacteroides sp. 224]NDV64278.1 CvpA family protein [Bacteroides sp. 224]